MVLNLFADDTDFTPTNFWHWVLNQGTTIVFLCLGLFITGKVLITLAIKYEELRSAQLKEATTRIQTQDQSILSLEHELSTVNTRLADCENDRANLRLLIEQKQQLPKLTQITNG